VLAGGPDDERPLAAALTYATLFGWRVVPNAGKVPIVVNWTEAGTTDPAQIYEWWQAHPEAGVSIVCGELSGLFVIDLDEHGAISGSDSLADLVAMYGPLPDTPRVLTGGGGQHIYFRWPPGATIRNDAGKRLGPGLDVRAEGGQVVAPPSRHASGQRYRWEASSMPAPPSIFGPLGGVELASPPAWLVDLLTVAPAPITRPEPSRAVSGLPGAEWAASVTWTELLQGDGATLLGERVDHRTGKRYELWARPGADHVSATLGYGDGDNLKVFTTNWPGLDAEASYSRFGFLAAKFFDGDHAAATRALAEKGYGRTDFDALVGKPSPAVPLAVGAMTLEALLTGEEDNVYDWLVPGLLERGDRVVITGDEGWGKSTLLRQLGVGATAGHNPFARSLLDAIHGPLRVLLVDCENSTRQLRREFPKVLRAVPDIEGVSQRFWVAVRTEGLILDQPRDPMGDRAWLEEQVAAIHPDVLLIGPLYKLMGGDPNAEQESRLLALYLDRVRGADAGMAVIIEAHAPHGQKRPYGWSGWKRWPEFGLHLSEDGSLTPFRGGRDEERHWPRHLRRGGDHDMPWVPTSQPVEAGGDREAEYDARVRQTVLRVLRVADRPMTLTEIVERTARRRSAVTAAVRWFQDHGWLLVERVERPGPNDSTRLLEVFALNPQGPAGEHDA
jgi:Bifunctional DNA primase/polymerase, N-terminal/AAA domain